MTPFANMPLIEQPNDAALVAACLDGDRSAYGQIVTRYQRLLCSLAYSSLGNMSESEDVAQEAFIEGWRKLRALREPEKLRSWLCGILRFKVSHRRRKESREPTRQAESLEATAELQSDEESVQGSAMREEEQALLWQALERVPELYREPLVLYYREHRSVEHVAHDLDLTEDAVKQRLSRGRKMLQEQMMSFVEGALARSTPGRVFTLSVLASLSALAPPAKAVGFGAAAAAHGGMMAKSTSLAAFFASFTGLANAILALRASLDQSRTPKEKRASILATICCFFGSLAVLAVIFGLRQSAYQWWEQRTIFATAAATLTLAFIVAWPIGLYKMMAYFRRLRTSERRLHPEYFRDPRDQIGSSAGEYRSRLKLFGIPLIHVRYCTAELGDPPAVAWLAGGDRAYGLLVAWGGVAIAPISVGAFSVGIISVGAVGFGVLSLGTVAVGLVSMGCLALGVKTYAWLLAGGWETAQSGGFALARLAAEGPIALARYANDPMAREILADPNAERNQMLFYIAIVLFSFLPVAYYAKEVRRRLGRKDVKK